MSDERSQKSEFRIPEIGIAIESDAARNAGVCKCLKIPGYFVVALLAMTAAIIFYGLTGLMKP
jgi:hypothetical protein